MRNNVYAVLLAGGKGTRLWPLSTSACPKSFVRIGREKPLIKQAIRRLQGLISEKHIIIVIERAQKKLLKGLTGGILAKNILVEPFGRSTASAVGLAALGLKPGGIMVVLPTDAMIKETGEYRRTLREAVNFIGEREGALVCVGVKPRRPETAYGYIKVRSRIKGRIHGIRHFVEKPDKRAALKFIREGKYLWNAGIFVFKVEDILEAMKMHAPLLHRGLMRIKKNKRKIREAYLGMKNVSIDYQVMEKAKNLYCAKGSFSWRDLGNWKSAGELFRKDRRGNNVFGKAALIDTHNSVVYNATKEKLGIVGIRDAIIVRTKNGTLVCNKTHAEKVKNLSEFNSHN